MPAKMTTSDFIKKAVIVHGDEYDYSCSIYTRSKDQINVLHKMCGKIFSCKPNNHLMGSGCSHCFQKVKSNITDFEAKARVIHGNKFDYSAAEYKSNKSKIKILCRACGDTFYQKPNRHLCGDGCANCSGSKPLTNESFSKKASKKHSGKYDYSMVDVKKSDEKVTIKCRGCELVFTQTPSNHLAGYGCPKCKVENTGWTKTNFKNACVKNNGVGTLYIIKCWNDSEEFYKVGITSRKISERFKKSAMPYQYSVISELSMDAADVWDAEKSLKRNISKIKYEPKIKFGGSTYECFSHITDDVRSVFNLGEVK